MLSDTVDRENEDRVTEARGRNVRKRKANQPFVAAQAAESLRSAESSRTERSICSVRTRSEPHPTESSVTSQLGATGIEWQGWFNFEAGRKPRRWVQIDCLERSGVTSVAFGVSHNIHIRIDLTRFHMKVSVSGKTRYAAGLKKQQSAAGRGRSLLKTYCCGHTRCWQRFPGTKTRCWLTRVEEATCLGQRLSGSNHLCNSAFFLII